MTPQDTPPSSDPLFGNAASDLLRGALAQDATQPVSDPRLWQPPEPRALQALLTEYEITAFLGRGGMGAVYRGRQISLDRQVAVKILPPGMEEHDVTYAVRFRHEALAMAQLNHHGIISVYDFGQTADGMRYIVMEFVDGTDVAHIVHQQRRLPSAQAIAITAHVCDALQYAHELGIIHRDIKPANIMVNYDGSVKVADFGLAKITRGDQTGLTRSGMAMGTLHYISPEGLTLGAAVDHRADLYAVGVMLYYMLTGHLPQGLFELPSLQVPGLDPRYDTIITRALRNDRELRYQSALEMRRDLDAILTRPISIPAQAAAAPAARPAAAPAKQPTAPRRIEPPRAKASNAGTWWLALVTVLLVVGIAWLQFTTDSKTQAVTSAPVSESVHRVEMKWIGSGFSALMRRTKPASVQATLKQPASIRQLPKGLTTPMFGEIKMGPSEAGRVHAFIINNAFDIDQQFYLDANANGDLTDDPQIEWESHVYKGDQIYGGPKEGGGIGLEIKYEEQVLKAEIHPYRYVPVGSKPGDTWMNYACHYGRMGTLQIGQLKIPIALEDHHGRGDFRHPENTVSIDLDGDGNFGDYQAMQGRLKDIFSVGGHLYEIDVPKPDGSVLNFVESQGLIGQKAPAFDVKAPDGRTIHVPGYYKGKILLVRMWASQYKNEDADRGSIERAFKIYQSRGFEVLSLQSYSTDKPEGNLWTEYRIEWNHPFHDLYRIHTLNGNFLIDCDSGKIVAMGLRGQDLEPAIAKALAEKKR